MKRVLSIGSLLAVVVAAGGCAPGGRSTAAEDHVRGQVVAFLQDWTAAIAANDAEMIRPMYVRDAARFAWFEDGMLQYTSAGEIIEALRGFPPGTTIQTELSDIAVMPLSTREAYASARFETRIDMATGLFSFDGVFTVLVELTDDGWVMVQGHTSRRREGGRESPEPTDRVSVLGDAGAGARRDDGAEIPADSETQALVGCSPCRVTSDERWRCGAAARSLA